MRKAILVGALVVMLVTAGYWLVTGRQQDVALAQVAEAMANVKSAHLVGWRFDPETGGRRETVECWVEGPASVPHAAGRS